MTTIAEIRLKQRCEGVPQASDFEAASTDVPPVTDGQVLVRNHYLSLDPYLRGKISGRHMSGAVHPGEVMAGETVGQVIESKSDAFKPGDLVHCFGGWASHSRLDAKAARKVNTHGLPLSLALGVLGMPGLTAYAGIVRLAAVKPGDVFVVSAASGPVGSAAAQLARLRGAKTIGIVGSKEKADWITGPAQFDGAINYRSETVAEGLKRTCPDGVDIYFDAIGGDVLEAVCEVLRLEARVVLYGLVAQYNSADRLLGPPPGLIIRARAHMHGLVVYDHEDLRADMEAEIAAAIKAGDFAVNEEVHEGLAAAPEAFHRLMSGQNFGKSIVKIFK